MEALNHEMLNVTPAVHELQGIVERLVEKLPKPIAELPHDAVADFLIRARKHVDFELDQPDGIENGTPLVVGGEGGFFTIDSNPKVVTASSRLHGLVAPLQRLTRGRILSGFVDGARVELVPPLALIVRRKPATLRDAQVSVLLRFREATFTEGGRGVNLEGLYETYVPLSYIDLIFHRQLQPAF